MLVLTGLWGQVSHKYADTCRMTWRDVSFGRKKLTELPFPSFPITQVSPMIKMKTKEVKNKVFKPHECVRYLTQKKSLRK